MREKKHILEELITKFLKRESSKEENELLDNFTSSFKRNEVWDKNLHGEKGELSETIFRNINEKISLEKKKANLHKLKIYSGVAASVLIMLGSFLFLNKEYNKTNTIVFETGIRMDSLNLVDGSTIYLSPGTTISYRENFNRKSRNVTLQKGNAFFKVAKNPDKPFIVESGELETKVLGTSFNILMHPNECKVTVHTGRVNVSSSKCSVNLEPFQEVSYSYNDQNLTERSFSRDELVVWYTDDIQLQNVKLSQVMEILQHKFGIQIKNAQGIPLKNKVTVFIGKDDSMSGVLNQLNYITDLKFEENENVITISN